MAKYHDGAVSGSRRVVNVLLTVLLAALCVVWLYPVLLILINSLKDELAISTATVFELPTQATFAGLHNYTYGITQLNFLQSFGYSATITITSVVLILLCCSMCGWYITRVTSAISKAMYLLCVFSMVVPFQMVMFTLSKTADTLRLNTPFNICVIYLGFGAGLAVFMFTGFMKSVPIAIEEAAMIDGCNPLQIFFKIVFPILKPTMISTATVFELPTSATFAGLHNYVYGITQLNFLQSFGYSAIITVSSVLLILLCCSMCGWYITRVTSAISKAMYLLCVFSMVVPFQMVMFTLSKTADTLRLNTPFNICVIYLGFGAGLAVFMFTGFMKSVPIAIEEAAMIDGCNPPQIFFKIVFPILKPTMISTAILETMWVWNDYLLPTLVLDIKKYRTIPMAIQYFRGSYGRVEMGPMMACIMITVLPIIVMYLVCQKYIIDGVIAGAVKG